MRRVADGIEDGIGFHVLLRERQLGLNSLTESVATRKVQLLRPVGWAGFIKPNINADDAK